MTPRRFLGAVVLPVALLAAFALLEKSTTNADEVRLPAKAGRGRQPSSLSAEIHIGGPLKSLTFESVSPDGMRVYEAEFGHGYVDLDLASLGPDGRAAFHSFRLRY